MSKKQKSPKIQTEKEMEDVVEQVVETGKPEIQDSENQEIEIDDSENQETEAVDQETESVDKEPTIEELRQQLEQAQLKAEENWDKAVRAQAEMENLKKRTLRDLENAHKFALEKFAGELLTVMDSLNLGIQASTGESPEVVQIREGSELTLKQLETVFAKFNIEAVDPTGEPFNPEHHQAMSMQPTSEYEPNTVVNVFQKGYLLNGRLLRPAMVIVAKAVEDTPKVDEQA